MSKAIGTLLTVAAVCHACAQTETGSRVWTATMTGISFFSGSRHGWHVAGDGNGNVYNVGSYVGELTLDGLMLPAVPNSYYFAKYSDDRRLIWAKVTEPVRGLVADDSGRLYVSGVFTNALFVAAFDTDGNATWRITGSVTGCDGIALHGNNLAIAGPLTGAARFGSINVNGAPNGTYLGSLNNQGAFRWAIQAGTNLNLSDFSSDNAGNILLAGRFTNPARVGTTNLISATGSGVFVSKFNSSGSFLWARQFSNPSGYDGIHVGTDGAGNVYLCREMSVRSVSLSKLDSSSALVWERGATSTDWIERLGGLAVDPHGNVYLTGEFDFDITFDGSLMLNSVGRNLFLAKYNSAGLILGAFTENARVNDMSVDPFGCVLVTGKQGDPAHLAKVAFSGASTPPIITSNPKDTGFVVGTTLTLPVGVISGSSITYQWQFHGTNLPGATASTLQRPNMVASFAGPYRVIVRNAGGALTSAVANVTLAFLPNILVQPVSQTLTLGSSVSFNVVANGTAPVSYQWWRDSTLLPGGTASTLNLTALIPGHEGGYRCVVSNPWGSATSVVARLDQVPHFQFESASYVVSEGGGFVPVFVRRAHRASGAVSVWVSTVPGNAFADRDYRPLAQQLNWADGDTSSKVVQVPMINDSEVEDNENFVLRLFSPSGQAVLGSPAVTSVVILDNDGPARFQFESPSVVVREGDLIAELRILRSGGGGQSCSISFETLDGTAIAGMDYLPTNGTLLFGSAEIVKSVFMPLIDDWPIESLENFVLRLHSPSAGAILASPNGVVTIDDRAHSFAEQFGHDLKIADFKNIGGGFADWVTGTLVITNPSSSASAPGYIAVGTSNFTFSPIPPGTAIDVSIVGFGGRTTGQTNYLYASLYEQTVNGPALQDTRAIYGFYYTAGGGPPSGGVPAGCCITTGQPVPGLPYVTNLLIIGPDLVNEASVTQYTARAMLSHGVVNDAPSVTWGVTAFKVSSGGLLTTTHVSSNVGFYLFVTNVFNAVTQVSVRIVTTRDLRARLAGATRLANNRHRITLTGPAGRAYDLQETTNLTLWTDVALVTNVTGTLRWTNAPNLNVNRRFYRAREH